MKRNFWVTVALIVLALIGWWNGFVSAATSTTTETARGWIVGQTSRCMMRPAEAILVNQKPKDDQFRCVGQFTISRNRPVRQWYANLERILGVMFWEHWTNVALRNCWLGNRCGPNESIGRVSSNADLRAEFQCRRFAEVMDCNDGGGLAIYPIVGERTDFDQLTQGRSLLTSALYAIRLASLATRT